MRKPQKKGYFWFRGTLSIPPEYEIKVENSEISEPLYFNPDGLVFRVGREELFHPSWLKGEWVELSEVKLFPDPNKEEKIVEELIRLRKEIEESGKREREPAKVVRIGGLTTIDLRR